MEEHRESKSTRRDTRNDRRDEHRRGEHRRKQNITVDEERRSTVDQRQAISEKVIEEAG